MLINPKESERLQENWGEKADALACNAEVRLYDPMSAWECYIYAQNPENDDEVMCIISTGKNSEISIEEWTLDAIRFLYNGEGVGVDRDDEYRPRLASEVFKQLHRKKYVT